MESLIQQTTNGCTYLSVKQADVVDHVHVPQNHEVILERGRV